MSSLRLPRPARAALLALVLLVFAPGATAQSFAVGGGGGVLADTKELEKVDDFSESAFFGYVEVTLDPGVILQGRYTRMTLPPLSENPFETDVDAATLSVAYLFNDGWWRAGFIGGVGAYFLRGQTAGLDQIVRETKESVFGLNVGLLTVFSVNRRWDVRVEAVGHFIKDEAQRKPLIASASVSYRF